MAETETVETDLPSIDIDASVESIAKDIFPSASAPTEPEPAETDPETVAPAPTTPAASAPATPAPRPAPRSWAKETHPIWEKLTPEAMDQIEKREKDILHGIDQYKTEAQFAKQIRDVAAPFEPMLKAHGLDAPRAFQTLLAAHARLTNGTPEQRQAAYAELGRNLGLTATTTTGDTPPADPAVMGLQQRLDAIERENLARHQRAQQEAQQATQKEVDAFFADTTAHPYADEVADDIARLVQTGLSLQEAYDKAVWANPVTREKELAKAKEAEVAKFKEHARLDSLPKKKAAGVNVRGTETRGAPTEPLGSMDDTLRGTLKKIQGRA